jgi:hypothetical protein
LAKNKLNSDFINQRLGGGSRQSFQPRAAAQSAADEDDAMSPGFIVGLLVLCLAVGGGTFYLAGSGGTLEDVMNGTTGPFISAADGACKSKWVPNGRNTPALVCYLSTNISRFCDPREKKHMATIMRSYRNNRVAHDAQMMAAGFKAVSIARSGESMQNIQTMSQSISKQQNNEGYELSAAENKAFEDHAKMVKRMEESVRTSGIMGSMGLNHISDEALAKKIRRLGTSGYLAKGDFGWFPDEIVSAAFKDIKVTGSACKS